MTEYNFTSFETIRELFLPENDMFIQSFDPELNTEFFKQSNLTFISLDFYNKTAGKSGSAIYQTYDSKFVIKLVPLLDKHSIRTIINEYFEHLKNNPKTLMSKIYGLYSLRIMDGGKIYFLIL